ncbi:hypothetical protein FBU31_003198, partial [Coemansia sp. 'formosensis']
MPHSPDHIYGIDDAPSRPSRTCTPPPPKANFINAGDETRSPSNKRKLLPTAAASSQDPSAGRRGKRARVDPAPFETPGGSSATRVSAPLAATKTSSSASTLPAATKKRSRVGTQPADTKRFKTDTPPTNTNSSGTDTPPAANTRSRVGTPPAATKTKPSGKPSSRNTTRRALQSEDKSQVASDATVKSTEAGTLPAADKCAKAVAPPTATKTKPSGKPSSSNTTHRAAQSADKIQVASDATAKSTEAGTLPTANTRSRAGTPPAATNSSRPSTPPAIDKCAIVSAPPVAASSSNHKNQATEPLHIVNKSATADTKRTVTSTDDVRASSRARAPSRVRAPNRVRDCACHECIDHGNHAPSNGSSSPRFPAALLPFNERELHMGNDAWARRNWKAKPCPLVNNLRGVQSTRLNRYRSRNTSHIALNEDDSDSEGSAGLADSGANTPSLAPNTLSTGAAVPMPLMHIGTPLAASNYGVFNSWLPAGQDVSNAAALQAAPGPFGVDTFVPMPLAAPSNGAISGQYPAGQDTSNAAALLAAPGMFGVDMPAPAALAASNYGVYDSWLPAGQDASNAAALLSAPGEFDVDASIRAIIEIIGGSAP